MCSQYTHSHDEILTCRDTSLAVNFSLDLILPPCTFHLGPRAPFLQMGITFIITGLMAIGFMSFGGMLTGGDEEAEQQATETVLNSEEVNTQPTDDTSKEVAEVSNITE